jgi:hypothetical protein
MPRCSGTTGSPLSLVPSLSSVIATYGTASKGHPTLTIFQKPVGDRSSIGPALGRSPGAEAAPNHDLSFS